MAEDALHRNLSAVFDPGPGYPSPGLVSRAIAALPDPGAGRHRMPARLRIEWVLPLVAALLAIAIVATLIFMGRVLHNAVVPVHVGPGALSCGTSGPGPFPPTEGGSEGLQPLPPAVTKMASPNIAWAGGGLRTTDGGLHWLNVLPHSILVGMDPVSLSNGGYPPGFRDFYLDGNHAWALREYSSTTSCDAEFATFETSDGGRTWQQSGLVPIVVPPNEGVSGVGNPAIYNPSIQIYFVDPQVGWVWIPMGPGSHVMGGGWEAAQGSLYGTSDGGRDWNLVSKIDAKSFGIAPPACQSTANGRGSLGQIRFLNRNLGWLSVTCRSAEGLTTRDGGRTWTLSPLPVPTVEAPIFFDAEHGVLADDQAGIFTTADGGHNWTGPLGPEALPAPAPTSAYFATPDEFWAVESAYYANVSWVYHSLDGGRTWTQTSASLDINEAVAVAFSDPLHGMILGLTFSPPLPPKTTPMPTDPVPSTASYVLLTTADGGHSWRTIVPVVGLAS